MKKRTSPVFWVAVVAAAAAVYVLAEPRTPPSSPPRVARVAPRAPSNNPERGDYDKVRRISEELRKTKRLSQRDYEFLLYRAGEDSLAGLSARSWLEIAIEMKAAKADGLKALLRERCMRVGIMDTVLMLDLVLYGRVQGFGRPPSEEVQQAVKASTGSSVDSLSSAEKRLITHLLADKKPEDRMEAAKVFVVKRSLPKADVQWLEQSVRTATKNAAPAEREYWDLVIDTLNAKSSGQAPNAA